MVEDSKYLLECLINWIFVNKGFKIHFFLNIKNDLKLLSFI